MVAVLGNGIDDSSSNPANSECRPDHACSLFNKLFIESSSNVGLSKYIYIENAQSVVNIFSNLVDLKSDRWVLTNERKYRRGIEKRIRKLNGWSHSKSRRQPIIYIYIYYIYNIYI